MQKSFLTFFDSQKVFEVLSFPVAIKALEDALRSGLDPESDAPRISSGFPAGGEFLLMPSQGENTSGVKVLAVAPDNPARGLPKIQGLYLLFDSKTAAPVAVIDGVSLTAIRTSAVTITAVKHLVEGKLPGKSPERVLVFGAGIQAKNHIRAAASLWPETNFLVIGRNNNRVADLVAELSAAGISVAQVSAVKQESEIRRADIILCCTSSVEPIFAGHLPKQSAIVAAIGTHGLDKREIDDEFVHRADVFVESRMSALNEDGNLVAAQHEATTWTNLAELVGGKYKIDSERPVLYTGVGMAWQDLVLAETIVQFAAKEAPAKH